MLSSGSGGGRCVNNNKSSAARRRREETSSCSRYGRMANVTVSRGMRAWNDVPGGDVDGANDDNDDAMKEKCSRIVTVTLPLEGTSPSSSSMPTSKCSITQPPQPQIKQQQSRFVAEAHAASNTRCTIHESAPRVVVCDVEFVDTSAQQQASSSSSFPSTMMKWHHHRFALRFRSSTLAAQFKRAMNWTTPCLTPIPDVRLHTESNVIDGNSGSSSSEDIFSASQIRSALVNALVEPSFFELVDAVSAEMMAMQLELADECRSARAFLHIE